ncbi:hypothetical protein EJ08DRAFT_647494 [Tothia fuscella]|uniref:Uncharacterized protein n=1 Tax=Tothia fuscella TaxID=1048955 RepID=A0A9P4NWQ8_9PEZI|nr:hypothetical protein EJ08DRAFT_647494 [Tothia fuscella]
MPGAFDSYTTTPKSTTRGPLGIFNSITQRMPKTPKDRTSIKPTGVEMHPHTKTTDSPYDESRWLGFFNVNSPSANTKIAAETVTTVPPTPVKATPTPAKTIPIPIKAVVAPAPAPAPVQPVGPASPSPEFEFTFRRAPSLELSDEAKKLMAETREQSEKIRAKLVLEALPSVPEDDPSEGVAGRVFAKPKGKAGRYSDVHMSEFKKMDSIANHPSAWRADPNRTQASTANLQRSPSKHNLAKTAPPPGSLKRSPSKAELDSPRTSMLKRSPSKAELDSPRTSMLKRSPSKIGLFSSALKRSPSKAQVDKQEDNPFMSKMPRKSVAPRQFDDTSPTGPSAKRVKRDLGDDAGTARPVSRDGDSQLPLPRTPSVTGVQRLYVPGSQPLPRMMTPTKASLARTQSVKNLRAVQSMIPGIVRSKSTKDLFQSHAQTPPRKTIAPPTHAASPSPTKVADFVDDSPVKAPELAGTPTSSPMSTPPIKSILRTPHRRYTVDPKKIAAGTHMATPPDGRRGTGGARTPATIHKHVNFTSSTKESEQKITRAMSVDHVQTVSYPQLPGVETPDRRTTEGPGAFTFRSNNRMSFDPIPASSTIRAVRSSDVGLPNYSQPGSPQKRKMDNLGEIAEEDKENDSQDEGDVRGAKKARKDVKPAPAVRPTPKKSKLPTRNTPGKRSGGLSFSRLAMLAMPKRR